MLFLWGLFLFRCFFCLGWVDGGNVFLFIIWEMSIEYIHMCLKYSWYSRKVLLFFAIFKFLAVFITTLWFQRPIKGFRRCRSFPWHFGDIFCSFFFVSLEYPPLFLVGGETGDWQASNWPYLWYLGHSIIKGIMTTLFGRAALF